MSDDVLSKLESINKLLEKLRDYVNFEEVKKELISIV